MRTWLLIFALLATGAAQAAPLRVVGSSTVNPVVAEAAEILRREQGLTILVDTQGGSSGGISAAAEGRAELGMSSRPLLDDDRKKFPQARLASHAIGLDGLALVVSRDLWDAGVRALSKAQVLAIYEGKVRNWKELGGPDRRVVFFNKEPGRGTWEVFVHWLYGDPKKAPIVSHPEVGANEEARQKVATTPGAISQLSFSWADGEKVFALGLIDDAGQAVRAEPATLASGAYPLVRTLFLVTNGTPSAEAQAMLTFLLSARGQALLPKHGYLPLRP
jgi:phosphate transport system substrate-binding protein